MSTLRSLLEAKGVPTRDGIPPEFTICCWKCGDRDFHMQVNEQKGWCYCYRRKCLATVRQMCRHFGVIFQSVEPTTLSTLSLSEKFEKTIVAPEKEANTTAPVFVDLSIFHPIPHGANHDSFVGGMARDYLHARGFNDTLIAYYHLRFASVGPYAGRIIVPFFENNKPVYFQARKFMGTGPKVMSPSTKVFPLGAHSWLYNFDMAKGFDEVIICEGWASAISAGPSAVAIQGNVASSTQLYKLTHNWDKFVVLLDSDALKEAIKLAKSLRFVSPQASVKMVYLPYGDPNDIYKEHANNLYDIIRQAKPFDEMEAMGKLCVRS